LRSEGTRCASGSGLPGTSTCTARRCSPPSSRPTVRRRRRALRRSRAWSTSGRSPHQKTPDGRPAAGAGLVPTWDHWGVPTTTTCPHGLDRSTCLICSTLGLTGVPTGRPEVIISRPPRRPRVGLLGGAVIALVVLIAVWLMVGLVWSLVRGAELII